MSGQDRDRRLDKLKKCLRLAKSSNEHEAAAALRQARKMMDGLGLSADDVAASEASEAQAKSQAGRSPPMWETLLASTVARAIGCGLFFRGRYTARSTMEGHYVFVGCSGAAEIAGYAYTSLSRRLRAARSEYQAKHLNRCKRASRVERANAFCTGWVIAVETKVHALVVAPENRAAIDSYMARLRLEPGRSENKAAKAEKAISRRYQDFAQGARQGRAVELRRPMSSNATEPKALIAR